MKIYQSRSHSFKLTSETAACLPSVFKKIFKFLLGLSVLDFRRDAVLKHAPHIVTHGNEIRGKVDQALGCV